jgi:hypothetical protein
VNYAAHHFKLNAREGNATLRAHLTALAKRGNAQAQRELAGPECPAWIMYLWRWFLQLHARRGAGMSGPARITWTDMDAWARLTGTDLSPWECDVFLALDAAFFDAAAPVT